MDDSLHPGKRVQIFATPWEVRAGRTLKPRTPRAFPDGLKDVRALIIEGGVEPGWWTCYIEVNGVAVLVEVCGVALEPTGEPDEEGMDAFAMLLDR